jgi:hypothetical protein
MSIVMSFRMGAPNRGEGSGSSRSGLDCVMMLHGTMKVIVIFHVASGSWVDDVY